MDITIKKLQIALNQEQVVKDQILVALYDSFKVDEQTLYQTVRGILEATGLIEGQVNDQSENDGE